MRKNRNGRKLGYLGLFAAATGLLTGSIMPDKKIGHDGNFSHESTIMEKYTAAEKYVQGFSQPSAKKTKTDVIKTSKVISKGTVSSNGSHRIALSQNYVNFFGPNPVFNALAVDEFDSQDLELAHFMADMNVMHELMGSPAFGKTPQYRKFYDKLFESSVAFYEHFKGKPGWITLEDITYPELKKTQTNFGKNYKPVLSSFGFITPDNPEADFRMSQGRYNALIDEDGSCIMIFNKEGDPQIRYLVAEDGKNTEPVKNIQKLLNLRKLLKPDAKVDVEPSYVVNFIKAATTIERFCDNSTTYYNSGLWKGAVKYLNSTKGITHITGMNEDIWTITQGGKSIKFTLKMNPTTGKRTANWAGWKPVIYV